jgi:hypothetical protein
MKLSSLFIVVGFMLSACGGSNSSDNEIADPLGINGKWVSNCYYDAEFDDYTLEEYTLSGYTIVADLKSFNDSSCLGVPYIQDVISGTFSSGEIITTSGGLQAIEFNATITIDNQDIEVFDLIRVDGNTFNWGVYIDGTTRPTAMDFNITYTKQ